MTNQQDAMEAAARALCQSNSYAWVEHFGDEWRKHAGAVVAAYLAAREAEGWFFAPEYPTEAMVVAGAGWREYDTPDDWPDEARVFYGAYRAMLAARPTNGDS